MSSLSKAQVSGLMARVSRIVDLAPEGTMMHTFCSQIECFEQPLSSSWHESKEPLRFSLLIWGPFFLDVIPDSSDESLTRLIEDFCGRYVRGEIRYPYAVIENSMRTCSVT